MNVPGSRDRVAVQCELRSELEHLIEANETLRIVLRETCATLMGVINTHLDQSDTHIRQLMSALDMPRR